MRPQAPPTSKLFLALFLATAVVSADLLACGGKGAEGPDDVAREPSEDDVSDAEVAEYMEDSRVKLDEEAAQIALDRGGRKARECRETADAPAGSGDVDVFFDGTKGRVTKVELSMSWSSIPEKAQKCIKNAFIGEIVPPFDGDATKAYTVEIPAEGEEPAEKDE